MYLIIELRDHADVSHQKFRTELGDESTLDDLKKEIHHVLLMPCEFQELFFENGNELIGEDSDGLQSFGLKTFSKVIVKHAEFPLWIEYKTCVELVLKQCADKISIAKQAVRLYERLQNSEFFYIYVEFFSYRMENHFKVAFWADEDVGLICEATEKHFHYLHDLRRGDQDSELVCNFEQRDYELDGRSTSILAFVRIHGEDFSSKFYVKAHHSDTKRTRLARVPDISELFCYKILELIGVGPKCHIIPPNVTTGTKIRVYIATEWDDNFDLMKNILDEDRLSADAAVQLVVLRVLLFITDLHEHNCGVWKGTNDAAIVDFAPTDLYKVHANIKSELFLTWPHFQWKEEFNAVKEQYDENSWLKIAKKYLDRWDLASKIQLAREQLDPTGEVLKSLKVGFEKPNLSFRFTEELDDYIDTLCQNLENLRIVLNSVVY